jgi:hypothetical protein
MVPWVKQGESTTWPFFVQDSSGDAVTGLTDGSFTKRISKAGGAWADLSATIAETENGWYTVAFSSSDTNTRGAMAVRLTASGAQQTNLLFQVVTRLPWEFAYPTTAGRSIDVATDGVVGINLDNASGSLTNGTDITNIPTVAEIRAEIDSNSTQLSAIVADTNELQTDDIPSSLTTIEGKIDNILADTNELQTDDIPGTLTTIEGKIDTIDGVVDSILVDTGTTLQGELDGIQADTEDLQTQIGTAGDGLTAIADLIWDEAMEGTETARQKMNLHSAVLLNKSSGGGTTTSTFRDAADGKNRISATTDANGNRTAVGTRDGS